MTGVFEVRESEKWEILLVDDDEDDYLLTQAWLSQARGGKFRLTWAKSYDHAMEILDEAVFNLLLIDYDLGAQSGLDLVRALKEKNSRLPVVMLTGRGSYAIDMEAMRAGVTDYLAKAEVSPPLLERTIRYAIERKRIEDELMLSKETLEERVRERTKELERVYHEIREREEWLRRVVTGAPVILLSVNREGVFTVAEGSGLTLLGSDPGQLVGHEFRDVLVDHPSIIEQVERGLQGEDFVARVRVNKEITFDTHYSPITNDKGETDGVIIVAMDVSGHVRDQEQIAYQAYLLENIHDAVVATNRDLSITAWNASAEEMYGWSGDEAIGQNILKLIETEWLDAPPDDVLLTLRDREYYTGEVVQSSKDGRRIYAEVKISTLRGTEGWIAGFVAISRDITARKMAEAEINEVQRRLMDRNEAERRELAQELHDGPMQDLYGVTFQLASLRSELSTDKNRLQVLQLERSLRRVIESLRTTSVELRPPALVPYGLEKAVRSHAERFIPLYPQLDLQLELEPDGQNISEKVRLALFRIYQVALMNVVRHADATKAVVRLKIDGRYVSLEVEDNGKGFHVPERWLEMAREGHLGLVGAQERADAVGASFRVSSEPGEGTLISVSAPLNSH